MLTICRCSAHMLLKVYHVFICFQHRVLALWCWLWAKICSIVWALIGGVLVRQGVYQCTVHMMSPCNLAHQAIPQQIFKVGPGEGILARLIAGWLKQLAWLPHVAVGTDHPSLWLSCHSFNFGTHLAKQFQAYFNNNIKDCVSTPYIWGCQVKGHSSAQLETVLSPARNS